ncbi:hypothetical protein J8Z86_08440 [Yersinia enterocolitica]|uniref:hypothetical protein n=1 Tax=Yersinia enterocolitica TaxID=630 RepID=UPI001C8E8034|nr:hypothetical protein [Yersinia enterocolitica]MBX9496104.1 hypothetical protein [Yersinia enterocolitica]
MNNIEELKRFIYSATVTSGSGSQSFYIDAESREEADARAANNESDGMYADDSEITDLDALEYEDETTVDDFGDFPLISREQSLIAQQEAAQKENENDNKLKYIRRLEDEKRTEANTINVQRRQNLELMSENASLKDCVESAEAELSAAQQRISELEIYQKEEIAANLVLSAALSAANKKLSKIVVLPEPTAHLIWCMGGSGPDDYYEIIEISHGKDDLCFDGSPRCPVYTDWEIIEAIKAAGFTVEE